MAKTAAKPVAAVPPVVILAGPEVFLRDQAVREIQRATLGEGDPGMALVRMDQTAAIADVLDECRMPSMFAPKKLVVVDPADALLKGGGDDGGRGKKPSLSNREILENYVESPSDSAVLVLVCNAWLKTTRLHKALDKQGAVRWCEPIKEPAAPAWIAKRAREAHEKQIEPAAAQRLAELIGPDLQRLDNELAKLALYQPENPTIALAAVDALVGFQHEQQIWDMINALGVRDAATALKKIDELWAMDDKVEFTVVGAVFFWLNNVLKARELVDRRLPDAVIIRDLKLWPPERAQQILKLARDWGVHGAARQAESLLKVDLNNKSSVGDARKNIEHFIVMLCQNHN